MMNNDASATSFLTESEVKEIDNAFLKEPKRALTFNQVFPPKQLRNPNAKVGQYYIQSDDAVVAGFVERLKDAKRVTVTGKQVTYSVYKAALSYNLDMTEIDESRKFNTPIDVRVVNSLVRKIQEKMNSLAYVGDSTFGVNGIMDQTANMTAITGSDISSTTTPAAVANVFIKAFNDLDAKHRESYNYKLVVPDAVHKYLVQIGNTTTDGSAKNQILSALSTLVDIIPEGQLDSGTTTATTTVANGIGVFIPQDQEATNMPIGYLPRNNMKTDEAYREIEGTGEARFGPVELIFPEAYGYITGLLG